MPVKTMKYLSIIIPVYNVAQYLPKCLDSVIYPGTEGYEIIAVNDGSTDASPEILEDYRRRYPQLLRIITKENGGLGSARNAALEPAEGEFLYFLDSDDYLAENAVKEILDACQKENFDICFFDSQTVNEDGKILEEMPGFHTEGSFRMEDDPDILLFRTNAFNKVFRRSLFLDNNIRFRDREWYEDVSCIPKLYAEAGAMYYRRRMTYNYLMRPGSIMNNRNLQRNMEIISAYTATITYYREKGIFAKYHEQLEYVCFYNILIAATVRVNLIDPNTEIQDRFLEFFTKEFPDYRKNRYFLAAPKKYRLLDFLITYRMHHAVHFLMSFNDKVRH